LAASEASVIANAIISSNLKSLEAVPGLGKKGAQRLVLELKDKAASFAGGSVNAKFSVTDQVENALQGLGYSAKEASAMISQISGSEKIKTLNAAEILKLALKTGGKK
jgi:Holliday junction DNA helicase RuvA